jgi:hypothetical protein
MSNCEAEIEALISLLTDARAEIERSADQGERNVLELYCEYIMARLARLRADPNLC